MNFILIGFLIFYFMYHTNKYVYRILLFFLGFQIDRTSIKNLPSRSILISTHTSIYDFIIGMFIYYGYLHKKFNNYILMKQEYEYLTSPFMSIFDKKIKLIEVQQNKSGLVNQIIDEIKYMNNYILYLSPEGTRNYTENLRTGYWVIAKELNLDIIFIGIDFYNKTIKFETPRKAETYWDDEVDAFKVSAQLYRPLFPENCSFYNLKKENKN